MQKAANQYLDLLLLCINISTRFESRKLYFKFFKSDQLKKPIIHIVFLPAIA